MIEDTGQRAYLLPPLRARHPDWFGVHRLVQRLIRSAIDRKLAKLSRRDRERIKAAGYFRPDVRIRGNH